VNGRRAKDMKKSIIRSLLCISLSAMLILGNIGTGYAADDTSEEENYSTQVLEAIEETSENVNVEADEDEEIIFNDAQSSSTEMLEIGDDFTVELLTYKVIGSGEVEVEYCDTSAESINIPKYISYEGYEYQVTSIRNYGFVNCSSLQNVTISEGITSIGEYAFDGCKSLSSIIIPEGVTDIGGAAFADCSSLSSVTIPEGVTSIEWFAFADCSSLSSVSLPEGLISIGDSAFEDCSSLSSVECYH
jgi:hypothetical protein